jgi:hypothetical protein
VRFEAPGGGWLSIGLDGGHASRPVVAGDTVTYRGVAAGADLSYRVTPDALKESITLASPSAAASSFGFMIRVGGGLVPWQRPDGSIALSRDGVGGAPVLVLPKPVMTDSRPDRWSPYGTAWSPQVTQRVTWDAAAAALHVTVTPDAGWLHQRARRFPVVVDPTIMIAPTPTTAQNTFIEQDTPSANYDSSWRLSVGTTSGGAVRALLKFPLSAIPAGTQIDSADLRLYADQYFGSGGSQAIEADQAAPGGGGGCPSSLQGCPGYTAPHQSTGCGFLWSSCIGHAVSSFGGWLGKQGSNLLGGIVNGIGSTAWFVSTPWRWFEAQMLNSIPRGVTPNGQLTFNNHAGDSIGSSAAPRIGIGDPRSIIYKAGYYGWPLFFPAADESEVVNAAGEVYPNVIDPRTGDPIPAPASGLTKVPVSARVPWGPQERAAYIKEWYDLGLSHT